MINLTIQNSFCKIEGLTDNQFKALREILSYEPDTGGYKAGLRRPTKRYLIDRKGQFPSGLLDRVNEYLGKLSPSSHPRAVKDLRRKPKMTHGMFNLNLPHKPYPEQGESAEVAAHIGQGTISMPTGSGKSVAMALLIHELQMKTLVIVPNLNLKAQLSASFKAYFGSLDNLTIENVDSPALEKAKDYDVLIIDEAHHAAASTYRQLNSKAWTGIYHRYFYTATPYRSREEEHILMQSVTGGVIYALSYQTAVDKGYICPVEAYYIDLPKKAMKGDPSSWAATYSELVVHHEVRNSLIAALIASADAPCLTLVKEVKHGQILSDLTGAPFTSGVLLDTRIRLLEFNLGEIKSLIGTVGVLGEGADTKPCEYVILAAGGKSKNSLMQQIGRGLRVSPGKKSVKVFMFRDKSNKFLLKHFNLCVKHIKEEYGITPIKLDVCVPDLN